MNRIYSSATYLYLSCPSGLPSVTLSRYLINSIMIKFSHKSRSYQNHNTQFTCVWPIRINTLRYYFLFSQLSFIYLTYNSQFSVAASDSLHTRHKQYTASRDDQTAISTFVPPRGRHTPSRIPAQSQLAFPDPGGKPSSLVMPSSVRSCTVTPINTDFLSN